MANENTNAGPEGDGDDGHRLGGGQVSGRTGLSFGARLRNYFLTGLVIVGPVSITIFIVQWFINFVDAWMSPLIPDIRAWIQKVVPEGYLPEGDFYIPGIGLVMSIVLLTFIGALAANLFGRTIISYGELLLNRMPVVRSVYSGLKQIFETVLSQSNTSFQKVGLVEYPRRGLYAIVFISTETTGEIHHRMGDEDGLLSVFLPTTPNPTSGYLLFVPKEDVVILSMSVEEAAKMVISAGLVTPEFHQGELASLRETGTPLVPPAVPDRPRDDGSVNERDKPAA